MSNSLKDLLTDGALAALQKAKQSLSPVKDKTKVREIKPGDIFKIKANEKNGITPKDGGPFWPKHFIALGKLADGRMFCCAVFDSEINRDYIHPDYQSFFLPVKAGQYPFLTHDSYIDCLEMKYATPGKLLSGKPEGRLTDKDLSAVLELVRQSPKHDFVKLSMYGLK